MKKDKEKGEGGDRGEERDREGVKKNIKTEEGSFYRQRNFSYLPNQFHSSSVREEQEE